MTYLRTYTKASSPFFGLFSSIYLCVGVFRNDDLANYFLYAYHRSGSNGHSLSPERRKKQMSYFKAYLKASESFFKIFGVFYLIMGIMEGRFIALSFLYLIVLGSTAGIISKSMKENKSVR